MAKEPVLSSSVFEEALRFAEAVVRVWEALWNLTNSRLVLKLL